MVLYNIYNKLAKSLKKVNAKLYNQQRAQLYLEGLLWGLNMYKTGQCSKYDYLYEEKTSPHPYELLFHILAEPNNINIPSSETKPIDVLIYPLIILPKKADYLMKKEYHNLMETKLKYLYDAEMCNECSTFRQKLDILIKEKASIPKDNKDDIKKWSLKYKSRLNKYKNHKKCHYNSFGHEDINRIIEYVNEL